MKNWLDEYEPSPSDATRVNRTVIPKDVLLKGRVTQQQLDERVANDRRKRIADSNSAKNEKYTSKNWKSKLARETQATGDKLRRSPYPNFFDDYVNPAAMIGNMASGLGQVPLDIEQGNYGQAALNVALPLATGALAGIGAKTTGQFVNNLVNPLAGTEEFLNNSKKSIINKLGFNNSSTNNNVNNRITIDLNRPDRNRQEIYKFIENVEDPNFKIKKIFRGNKEFPKEIKIEGKTGQWTANRNSDGTYYFSAGMENPLESGKAMLKMNDLLPSKPVILEPKSLSLDSYKNVLKLGKRPHWNMEFDDYIPLNYYAKHNKKLDPMVNIGYRQHTIVPFTNLEDANVALEEVNNMLKTNNLKHQAKIFSNDRGWYGVHIPNFKLSRDYENGGEVYTNSANNFLTKSIQDYGENKNPKNNSKFKMNMGGSLPGVTGMMYARTGAPSNGKYAKKTKPSAEDGIKAKKENSFLEDLYSNLNPYNLGVKDYSKHKDFNTAFDKARKSNEEEFMWNGKRYNTRKDDDYIPVIGDTKDKRYSKYIREEYPEFNKVLNRGRNASKIVRKGLNLFGNNNRAYIVGSKIYAGSQASPIEFLDNVIAESGHLKSQYSNLFNLAKERLLYGEDVYNKPNTKEFYDHRLVEPAMRILADGNLSPKDIKRIQKFLGVTQDGYLGPVTYEAIKNKYKDDPYIKDLIVHENNKDYPFIDNTLSEIYLNRLNEDVPLKQINRFKDNISFPMNYSDDALLNESVSNMDIKYLQQSLKNRDYGLPNSHKYGILLDGILGKETQAALEDWRNKQKLNKKKKQGSVVNKLKNGGGVSYNQLVNFTNYNKPTSGGWLDEI